MPKKILEDDREILTLWFMTEEGESYTVGSNGVTGIEAYAEPGPYCELPFFAVWKGDHITARVPAPMVTVVYEEP